MTAQRSIRWHLVTVSYNSADVLAEHWSRVSLPEGFLWTVVDNASTDESVEVARRLGAHVIELPANIGFGAANNVGAGATQAAYVAFVNPDVTIDVDSFETAERLLDWRPDAVVAPQLLDPSGRPQASGRGLPTFTSKILNRIMRGDRSDYRIFAEPGVQRFVSWAMGAALLMRRPVFERIGWDERFFVYYEDHDLGLRAWRSGYEVILSGDIRWTHAWARETTRLNLAAWRLELSGMLRFYSRYPHLLLPYPIARRRHSERHLIGRPLDAGASMQGHDPRARL